jgi:hypothetical protein
MRAVHAISIVVKNAQYVVGTATNSVKVRVIVMIVPAMLLAQRLARYFNIRDKRTGADTIFHFDESSNSSEPLSHRNWDIRQELQKQKTIKL